MTRSNFANPVAFGLGCDFLEFGQAAAHRAALRV
jgi:hypothetical protein